MKIIIDKFISQLTKILVVTFILSVISSYFFYLNFNNRTEILDEYDEKKLIKVIIKPKINKHQLIFEEALNVIFLTRFINNNYIDLTHTLPSLKFSDYKFESNIFLNFDEKKLFQTFDQNLINNTSDFIIENYIDEENNAHLFFYILQYYEDLEYEILNKVRIYIEKQYKESILTTLDDLIDFKLNYFDPLNKKRLEKLFQNRTNEPIDINKGLSSIFLFTTNNFDDLINLTRKQIEENINDSFSYKVNIKDVNQGRKAFETNISSIIIITISILLSFILSSVFFISQAVMRNDG